MNRFTIMLDWLYSRLSVMECLGQLSPHGAKTLAWLRKRQNVIN